ncbi:hypothetical protein B0H11DRAFT_1113469 [Mycena galericulata]|nr:hypothetical protein B0H11DRAFT_1113469 [Mycena galericulata]
MDSRRAQTLEALGTFIAQQKALLARTQIDLETLRRLKSETVADAGTSAVADVGTLADQLSGSAFRLSEQADCAPSVPDIHWDLFARKGLILPLNHSKRFRMPVKRFSP